MGIARLLRLFLFVVRTRQAEHALVVHHQAVLVFVFYQATALNRGPRGPPPFKIPFVLGGPCAGVVRSTGCRSTDRRRRRSRSGGGRRGTRRSRWWRGWRRIDAPELTRAVNLAECPTAGQPALSAGGRLVAACRPLRSSCRVHLASKLRGRVATTPRLPRGYFVGAGAELDRRRTVDFPRTPA